MIQQRLDFFTRLTKEEKLCLTSQDFTKTEFIEIIYETMLNEIDKLIATYRYIECMTFEEISEKLDIDLKTCRNRIKKIDDYIRQTYLKLFYR